MEQWFQWMQFHKHHIYSHVFWQLRSYPIPYASKNAGVLKPVLGTLNMSIYSSRLKKQRKSWERLSWHNNWKEISCFNVRVSIYNLWAIVCLSMFFIHISGIYEQRCDNLQTAVVTISHGLPPGHGSSTPATQLEATQKHVAIPTRGCPAPLPPTQIWSVMSQLLALQSPLTTLRSSLELFN